MTAIRCPRCSSSDVTVEFDSVVFIKFDAGRLVLASVGGVLGSMPNRIFCSGCSMGTIIDETTDEFDDQFEGAVISTLPESAVEALEQGLILFDRR